jgi:hypothetical protein
VPQIWPYVQHFNANCKIILVCKETVKCDGLKFLFYLNVYTSQQNVVHNCKFLPRDCKRYTRRQLLLKCEQAFPVL